MLEGYAETRPASGIFATKPPVMEQAVEARGPAAPESAAPLPPYAQRKLRPGNDQHRLSFDFFPGRSNASLFPCVAGGAC